MANHTHGVKDTLVTVKAQLKSHLEESWKIRKIEFSQTSLQTMILLSSMLLSEFMISIQSVGPAKEALRFRLWELDLWIQINLSSDSRTEIFPKRSKAISTTKASQLSVEHQLLKSSKGKLIQAWSCLAIVICRSLLMVSIIQNVKSPLKSIRMKSISLQLLQSVAQSSVDRK